MAKFTQNKIVVFLPNWLGDVVMATPALRAIRQRFTNDHITFVGRPGAAQILAGTPWADDLFIDVSAAKRNRFRGAFRLVAHLRRLKATVAILMPNSFRSAMMARVGGVRRIVGYDRDGRGWLLSQKLQPQRDGLGYVPVPAIDYYAALAESAGARVTDRQMELPVVAEDETAAKNLLAEAGVTAERPLVMLNPGAAFGTSKLWDPRRFAAVADDLIERYGAQIIINAAPSERHIAARVGELMRHAPVVNFATRNNSVGMLKSLLKRCTMLVTNDTGARHIAAAFGIKIVTVFGSTDPDWTTLHYAAERLVRVDVPCSPCQSKICRQPAGPLYHQCMTAVSVPMVLSACEELLGSEGSPPSPAAQSPSPEQHL